MPIIDRFGRPVTGVRISLMPSSRCNFSCVFCHREGVYENPEKLMTAEEIERVVRVLTRFGVDSVKLTGGEPMLRPDVLEVVERLGGLGLRDLSMTTNGTRLPGLARELRERGLRRVNISLHSVDPRKFCWITGHDEKAGARRFQYVVNAVRAALEAGLKPVKLNVVVMKGVNEDEVDGLIGFARELGGGEDLILQLIELVPEGSASNPEFFNRYFYSLRDVEKRLEKEAVKVVTRRLHMRRQYLLPNGVWVELVRPANNHVFCMNDNRIRITHDGKFKPCLMRDDNHVDFLTAMRRGADDEEIGRLFLEAVRAREPYWKPPGLRPEADVKPARPGDS